MSFVKRELLIPLMDQYRNYLKGQKRTENDRPLSNMDENYKREIAEKATLILDSGNWKETEIGEGSIADRVIKAVQRNVNLVGRYQVSAFADKVKEKTADSERIFFDLYHNHQEEACFSQICDLFGRKYDLVAYLFFIADPDRFLPLRSSRFDEIFEKLNIELRTSGRCSWDNYQSFLDVVSEVRDAMRERYQDYDEDLLDAHSFLWTLRQKLPDNNDGAENIAEDPVLLMTSVEDEGDIVFHKEYGKGTIAKFTEKNIYVMFSDTQRIFPYPEAFEKGYLKKLP